MPRKYSAEFREDAVRMLVDNPGLTISKAARDLGIGMSTLDKWLRQYRASTAGGVVTGNDLAELRRLRLENQKLKLERELLKKAAVFFAKDSGS
jgi:transposase